MTEYIQVDRDQLRVGMRFDYRLPNEEFDTMVRRLSNTSPLVYDVELDGGESLHSVTLTDKDLEDRTFWVHPDDLHVDDREDAETMAARAVEIADEAYEKGVRDGYAKAAPELQRRDIRREDAVLWAVQALGGTPEAAHLLIPLAQQVERYVNGNDEQEKPPVMDGGFLPVGTRVEVQDGGRNVAGVIDEVDPDV